MFGYQQSSNEVVLPESTVEVVCGPDSTIVSADPGYVLSHSILGDPTVNHYEIPFQNTFSSSNTNCPIESYRVVENGEVSLSEAEDMLIIP